MTAVSNPKIPPPLADKNGWPWIEVPQEPNLSVNESWPLISIITPSYNQGAFIEETIRSILCQDYPYVEHIVIDAGSQDETLSVLQHYSAHIKWVSEPDEGQADAINKGIKQANGQILAYLNSDDYYMPGVLTQVAAQFFDNPTGVLIYGDCLAVWGDGAEKGLIEGHPFNRDRIIQRGEFVPQQSAFWTRTAADEVGLFDKTLHFAMDHDYFIRLGMTGPALYVPETWACFRFAPHTKSVSAEDRHWRESLMVSERHGLKPWQVWYWWRRIRHYGLRLLPDKLGLQIRKRLNRPQDGALHQTD